MDILPPWVGRLLFCTEMSFHRYDGSMEFEEFRSCPMGGNGTKLQLVLAITF
jgi:hypothetical protein